MMTQLRRSKWRIVVILVALFLSAPTLIVIPMSFSQDTFLQFPPQKWGTRWYAAFFHDQGWHDAIWMSVKTAVLCTVFATILGTLTAYALSRSNFIRGRGFILGLVLSPAIVPIVVVGLGDYFAFAPLGLTGTLAGLVLAHVVLAFPFVIVAVSANLAQYDRNLDRAAASCGAGNVRTFFRIALPAIWPGVVTGALFAFVTSWDETVVALLVTDARTQTLPVRFFTQIQSALDPTIAVVATLLMFLVVAFMIAAAGGAWLRARRRVRSDADVSTLTNV